MSVKRLPIQRRTDSKQTLDNGSVEHRVSRAETGDDGGPDRFTTDQRRLCVFVSQRTSRLSHSGFA